MRILSAVVIFLCSSAAFAADMPAVAVQQQSLQVSANQLAPVYAAPQQYQAYTVYTQQQAAAQVQAPAAAQVDTQERKVDIMWMNSF